MYLYDLEYFSISQMDRTSPQSSNMELAKYNYSAYGKIIMYVRMSLFYFFCQKACIKEFLFVLKIYIKPSKY